MSDDILERLRSVAKHKREDVHRTFIVMSGDGELYGEAATLFPAIAELPSPPAIGMTTSTRANQSRTGLTNVLIGARWKCTHTHLLRGCLGHLLAVSESKWPSQKMYTRRSKAPCRP